MKASRVCVFTVFWIPRAYLVGLGSKNGAGNGRRVRSNGGFKATEGGSVLLAQRSGTDSTGSRYLRPKRGERRDGKFNLKYGFDAQRHTKHPIIDSWGHAHRV